MHFSIKESTIAKAMFRHSAGKAILYVLTMHISRQNAQSDSKHIQNGLCILRIHVCGRLGDWRFGFIVPVRALPVHGNGRLGRASALLTVMSFVAVIYVLVVGLGVARNTHADRPC